MENGIANYVPDDYDMLEHSDESHPIKKMIDEKEKENVGGTWYSRVQ